MNTNQKKNRPYSKNFYPKNVDEKIRVFKDIFKDFVDRNFVARCHFVQAFYDDKVKAIVRVVDDLNPPPSAEKALRFPLIALNLDFRCIRAFVHNRENVEFEDLFTEDPVAKFYDELIRLDLLDEYKVYRAKVYSDVFDEWAREHRAEIDAIDFKELFYK